MPKVLEQYLKKVKKLPSPVLRQFLEESAEYVPRKVLQEFMEKIPKEPKKARKATKTAFESEFEEEHPTPELLGELERRKPEDYFITKFPNWDTYADTKLSRRIEKYFKVKDFPERDAVSDYVFFKLRGKI